VCGPFVGLFQPDGTDQAGDGCPVGKDDLVLLAYPGLVREPDFYRIEADALILGDACQRDGEVFSKASTAPSAWAWCLGRAESLRQFMARIWRLSVCTETETRNSSHSHCPRSHSAPAHHAVDRRDRAAFQHCGQCYPMSRGQQRGGTFSTTVDQPWRPLGVEAQHPVADDLQGDAAQLRRLRAGAAIADDGERQKSPGLRGILAAAGEAPELLASEVRAKGDDAWHDVLPVLISMHHISAASGNPFRERRDLGIGITLHRNPGRERQDEPINRADAATPSRRGAGGLGGLHIERSVAGCVVAVCAALVDPKDQRGGPALLGSPRR
jgi:hypothetical protein